MRPCMPMFCEIVSSRDKQAKVQLHNPQSTSHRPRTSVRELGHGLASAQPRGAATAAATAAPLHTALLVLLRPHSVLVIAQVCAYRYPCPIPQHPILGFQLHRGAKACRRINCLACRHPGPILAHKKHGPALAVDHLGTIRPADMAKPRQAPKAGPAKRPHAGTHTQGNRNCSIHRCNKVCSWGCYKRANYRRHTGATHKHQPERRAHSHSTHSHGADLPATNSTKPSCTKPTELCLGLKTGPGATRQTQGKCSTTYSTTLGHTCGATGRPGWSGPARGACRDAHACLATVAATSAGFPYSAAHTPRPTNISTRAHSQPGQPYGATSPPQLQGTCCRPAASMLTP